MEFIDTEEEGEIIFNRCEEVALINHLIVEKYVRLIINIALGLCIDRNVQ